MLKMDTAERTCLAVELVLTKKHGLKPAEAKRMLQNSVFYQTLQEDPIFVGHRSADFWAKEILDEYSVPH
ncbi:hypothetical protein [Cohnella silvisoli]|uniref:Uncharacterized protein n=1 Tax=Cohnella silvisoli TaxID=2873699 RepID=A0ABV1L124_9BACL|nr:hypothetical protein [Cohnella silvisoli]MCD9025161.1 hypothetical protein [Cohnella silvisoli]